MRGLELIERIEYISLWVAEEDYATAVNMAVARLDRQEKAKVYGATAAELDEYDHGWRRADDLSFRPAKGGWAIAFYRLWYRMEG